MASIDFPNNPQINDIHIHEDVSWSWDGVSWKRLFEDYNFSSKIGIGTSSPQEEIHIKSVTPVIRIEDIDGGYMQIVGSDGSIRFDADNTNSIADTNVRFIIDNSEKFRIETDGSVGIGTSQPQEKLDVYGDIKLGSWTNDGVIRAWTSRGTDEGGNSTNGSNLILKAGIGTGSGTNGQIEFHTEHSTLNYGNGAPHGSGSAKMVIDSDGKVGIGTTDPDQDVFGSAEKILHMKSSNVATLRLESTHSAGADFEIAAGNSQRNVYMWNKSNGGILFATNNSEVMRINASGNVDIGNSSSNVELKVNGHEVYHEGNLDINSIGGQWTVSGSDIYYNTGSVGIGTTSPDAPLHVNSGLVNNVSKFSSPYLETYISFESSGTTTLPLVGAIGDDLMFATNSAERLRIDSDGNVGIGTTSPSSILAGTKGLSIYDSSSPGLSLANTENSWIFYNQGTDLEIYNTAAGEDKFILTASGDFNVLTGKVGIGITAPEEKLHVNGYARLGDWISKKSFYHDKDYTEDNYIILIEYDTNSFASGKVEGFRNGDTNHRREIIFDFSCNSTAYPETPTDTEGEIFVRMGALLSGTDLGGFYSLDYDGKKYLSIKVPPSTNYHALSWNFQGRHSGTDDNFFKLVGYSELSEAEKGSITLVEDYIQLDNHLYRKGGNVGIGTNNPTYPLHVVVPSTAAGGIYAGVFENLSSEDGSQHGVKIIVEPNGGYPLAISNDSGVTHDCFTITNDGKVGIGTLPSEKLHVDGGSLRVDIDSADSAAIFAGGGSNLHIDLDSGYSSFRNTASDTSSAGFHFKSISNDLLTIRNDGKVGIGTTAPSAKLEIAGDKDATNLIIGAPLHTVDGGGLADYSEILFDNNYVTGSSGTAYIRHYANSHQNYEGALYFGITSSTGTTSSALAIRGTGETTSYNDIRISKSFPKLIIDSPGTSTAGDDWTTEGAMIALGESAGTEQNAALYLTYNGNGNSYIGMGGVNSSTGVPLQGYIHFTYNNNRINLKADKVGIGNGSASGSNSTAMGSSTASGAVSTAMGYNTTASGGYSLSSGYNSSASQDHSIAMGKNSNASKENAIAIGYYSVSSGEGSVSLGYSSDATGDYSTALGRDNTASGLYSTALGKDTTASGSYSTSMGNKINVDGNYSFGIGLDNPTTDYELTQANTMAIMGGKVGIGTEFPTDLLHVSNSNGSAYETIDSYRSDQYSGGLLISHSRGTPSSLSYLLENDYLGSISFGSNSPNGYIHYRYAEIHAITTQNHSATAGGTKLVLQTTANDTISKQDRLVIDQNGNVGIGTTSPNSLLHIHYPYYDSSIHKGDANPVKAFQIGEGSNVLSHGGIAMGQDCVAGNASFTSIGQFAIAMGQNSTASGKNSIAMGNNVTASGNYSFAVGLHSQANGHGSTAIGGARVNGHGASGIGTNIFVNGEDSVGIGLMGAGQTTYTLSNPHIMAIMGGNVGIGTVTPNYPLHVSGSILVSGVVNQNSDITLKENLEVIEEPIEKIKQISGYTFNMIDNEEEKMVGLVAQEVEEILPELISEDDEGIKSLAYGNMVALLVECIKKQDERIESQDERIKDLEKIIQELS